MAGLCGFEIGTVWRGQFLDGNKRTAVTSALTFLRRNGVILAFSEGELYGYMIGIAEKRYGKVDLADYLRRCSSEK